MEIKRSSWHFALNDILYSNPEKFNTLCSYFWRTVFSVFIVIIAFLAVMSVGMLYGIMLTDWYIDIHPNTMIADISLIYRRLIQIPLGLIGVVITFFIVKYLINGWIKFLVALGRFFKVLRKSIKKLTTKPLKTTVCEIKKEPSLIIEMIKAKKKKYCPTIEFKGKK